MPRVVPSQVVTVIDAMFPWAAAQLENLSAESPERIQSHQGDSPQVSALLAILQQLPQELLVMKDAQYCEFIASIAVLQEAMLIWQTRTFVLEVVPRLSRLHPITLVRRALVECPDAFPSPGTTDLQFISDQTLRENLRIDISTAERTFSNSEWKAATVLAGSIIEALLLWALQVRGSKSNIDTVVKDLVTDKTLGKHPGLKLENWTLDTYIAVANTLHVISPDTASQARLAKNFRNLIHPGRAQRLGQSCNRATARSALAAVDHTVRDLETSIL